MEAEILKHKGENFSISFDSKENIIFVEMWGRQKLEDAKIFEAIANKFVNQIPEPNPVKILVTTLQSIKTDHMVRRFYTDLMKKQKREFKIAICGVNNLIKIVAGFVIAAINKQNIKIFTTPEEGLKWIKEK